MDDYELQLAKEIQIKFDQLVAYAEGKSDNANLRRSEFRLTATATEHWQLNKLDKNGTKENIVPNYQLRHGNGCLIRRERKRKDGTCYVYWQASYYDAGVRKNVTAKTQEECYKRLRTSTAVPKQKKPDDNTLARWLEHWFYKYRAAKLKESSKKGNISNINDLSASPLGPKKLVNLNTEDIQDYMMSITAANTRKKKYNILNAALKKAVALGKIKLNPMEDVEIPSVACNHRRAFDFSEQAAFLKLMPEPYYSQFVFMFCTGLRVGELVALKYSDIDMENYKIFVQHSKGANSKTIESPKTKSSKRIIDFSPRLLEIIDIKKVVEKTTHIMLKKNFAKVIQELNITDLSMHCTRHTFSSVCYYCGIPDKKIQLWLGHSTLAMTMDTYTHILGQGTSIIKEYIADFKSYISNK